MPPGPYCYVKRPEDVLLCPDTQHHIIKKAPGTVLLCRGQGATRFEFVLFPSRMQMDPIRRVGEGGYGGPPRVRVCLSRAQDRIVVKEAPSTVSSCRGKDSRGIGYVLVPSIPQMGRHMGPQMRQIYREGECIGRPQDKGLFNPSPGPYRSKKRFPEAYYYTQGPQSVLLLERHSHIIR